MPMTWPRVDTPIDDVQAAHDYAVGADPVAEAFGAWMRTCTRAGWVAAVDVEVVGVGAAGGRVTAEPVRARWSVPAYRAAAMDGVAVQAADTDNATPRKPVRLLPMDFDLVDTGDLMLSGRDAVIMREHVRLAGDGSAEIDASVTPGRHVRSVGEDIQAGKLVLPVGHRIRPVDVAALAAAGHTIPRPAPACCGRCANRGRGAAGRRGAGARRGTRY